MVSPMGVKGGGVTTGPGSPILKLHAARKIAHAAADRALNLLFMDPPRRADPGTPFSAQGIAPPFLSRKAPDSQRPFVFQEIPFR